MGSRIEKLVFNSGVPILFYLSSESILNFRRVTGMIDLGECQSLDGNTSAFYVSPVQTPPPSNDGYFMFVNLESNNLRFLVVPAQNARELQC